MGSEALTACEVAEFLAEHEPHTSWSSARVVACRAVLIIDRICLSQDGVYGMSIDENACKRQQGFISNAQQRHTMAD